MTCHRPWSLWSRSTTIVRNRPALVGPINHRLSSARGLGFSIHTTGVVSNTSLTSATEILRSASFRRLSRLNSRLRNGTAREYALRAGPPQRPIGPDDRHSSDPRAGVCKNQQVPARVAGWQRSPRANSIAWCACPETAPRRASRARRHPRKSVCEPSLGPDQSNSERRDPVGHRQAASTPPATDCENEQRERRGRPATSGSQGSTRARRRRPRARATPPAAGGASRIVTPTVSRRPR